MILRDETAHPPAIRREIGHAGGYAPGATVIAVAGLHGNEPAGIRALERVFARIERDRIELVGALAGFAGHLTALSANRRHLGRDLNRVWDPERSVRLRATNPVEGEADDVREQRELLVALHREIEHARGPVIVLDLHTASSPTVPFVILGDTLRNREYARRYPSPIVLGLEEHVVGTLMEYMTALGHVGIAIEGGRHEDEESVDNLESALWLALEFAGCLGAAAVPDRALHWSRLERTRGLPGIVEIFHREPVEPGDEFAMAPGLSNFEVVEEGTALARRNGRELRAPRRCRVFLPLYQSIGEDLFFLARPLNPFWLYLSARLRRFGVPRLAPLLPGVSEHPARKDTLVVNLRIARFFTRKVFHLLGYRVSRPEDGRLLVERRPDDVDEVPPAGERPAD